MAGDFVMVQLATPRKPEVLRLSTILGVEPLHAFGLCVAAWMWFDEQTEDGRANGATEEMLDAVVCRAGFSRALREVGWLQVRDGSLAIPNFERLMGESAKKRAKNTKRQQQHRCHNSVTKQRDKSVTKEEKRREDESPIGDSKATASPRVTWMTPFANEWRRIVKGEMHCEKNAAAFSKLVKAHGTETVLVHWRNYLEQLERDGKVAIASVARFAETFGQHAKPRTDRTLFGGKASRADNPGNSGSEDEWAARFEAEQAAGASEASQEVAGKRSTG